MIFVGKKYLARLALLFTFLISWNVYTHSKWLPICVICVILVCRCYTDSGGQYFYRKEIYPVQLWHSSKAFFTNEFIRLQFKKFKKRVIGKHFDRSWSVQSPDLTPVDFFLGTTLKRNCILEESSSNQYHHNSGICVLFLTKYGAVMSSVSKSKENG